MDRLLVAVDPAVGVQAVELAKAWAEDPEGAALGPVSVQEPGGEMFLPGVVELVVVPLVVGVAGSAIYDVLRRLLARVRPAAATGPDVEMVDSTTAAGDRVVVIRLRSGQP
jgi:hypothetical protein